MWSYVIAALMLFPSLAHAVSVDTTSTAEGVVSGGTASTSHSHTIAADADVVLVCLAERDANASGFTANTASVTVGGASATQLIAVQESTPQVRMALFYKLAPTTGSQTVAATADTGADLLVTSVISLKGVSQTGTFNVAGSTSSTGTTNVDINSLASAVGEFAIMCGASATAASTASPDATAPTSTEQLDVAHTNATSVRNWVYTEDGAATSIDMRVDLASSVRMAAVAVSIRGDSVDSFGPLRRRQ